MDSLLGNFNILQSLYPIVTRNMEVITVAALARIHVPEVAFEWVACSIRLDFTNECFAMSENFDEHFYKDHFYCLYYSRQLPLFTWLVLSKRENYFQGKGKLLRNHTLWFTSGQAKRKALWIQVQVQSKLQSSRLFCHLLGKCANALIPNAGTISLTFQDIILLSFGEHLLLSCQ